MSSGRRILAEMLMMMKTYMFFNKYKVYYTQIYSNHWKDIDVYLVQIFTIKEIEPETARMAVEYTHCSKVNIS